MNPRDQLSFENYNRVILRDVQKSSAVIFGTKPPPRRRLYRAGKRFEVNEIVSFSIRRKWHGRHYCYRWKLSCPPERQIIIAGL